MEAKANNTKDKSDNDKRKQKDVSDVDNGLAKAINKAYKNTRKLQQQPQKKVAETPSKKPNEPGSFEEGQVVDGNRIDLDIQMEVENGDQLDENEIN